jgi:hypothetical protein
MSIRVQVLEYSRAPVVDGVIRGVKILGVRSKKGRTYPQAVRAKAIPLYENAPVYICHGTEQEKRKGQRRHLSHFGHIANVQESGNGLFGDLHVKQSHGLAGMICESDGSEFGLSHNANCLVNDAGTEVLEILRVDSVDLVDNPGTTVNLYEGEEEMDLAEMEAAQQAQAAQIEKLTEGQGKIVSLLESLQKPEPSAEPKKRVSAFEPVAGEDKKPQPTFGMSREEFARGLRGISGGTV